MKEEGGGLQAEEPDFFLLTPGCLRVPLLRGIPPSARTVENVWTARPCFRYMLGKCPARPWPTPPKRG